MNETHLLGHMTAEPETRTTQSGISVCKFRIGVSRPKDKNGNRESDFINITAWNKTAELIQKYFHKGDPIIIHGSIRTGSYKDKDGRTVYTTEVFANNIEFLPGNGNRQNSGQQNAAPAQQDSGGFTDIDPDELPF